MPDLTCPQCRSDKVEQDALLEYATCNYCTNEFYPTTYEELQDILVNSTEVELPSFSNPLTIMSIDEYYANRELTVYLEGTQSAEYKLTINTDHEGKLSRRKGDSERNQFGSKWTNPTECWPTSVR